MSWSCEAYELVARVFYSCVVALACLPILSFSSGCTVQSAGDDRARLHDGRPAELIPGRAGPGATGGGGAQHDQLPARRIGHSGLSYRIVQGMYVLICKYYDSSRPQCKYVYFIIFIIL